MIKKVSPKVRLIALISFFLLLVYLTSSILKLSDYLIHGFPQVHKIYSSIDDLHQLDKYSVGTPIDTRIGALRFESSYSQKILYDSRNYEVFAYVFSSTQDVEAYYKRFTNNTTTILPESYSWCGGEFGRNYYIAYRNKSVLVIENKDLNCIADPNGFASWSFQH